MRLGMHYDTHAHRYYFLAPVRLTILELGHRAVSLLWSFHRGGQWHVCSNSR